MINYQHFGDPILRQSHICHIFSYNLQYLPIVNVCVMSQGKMNLIFLESTGKGTERETAAACQTVQLTEEVEGGTRLSGFTPRLFLMGKSTISMAIFNSKLLVYQRVYVTITS